MKLGIIVNTDDVETAWNALRLSNEAITQGHVTTIFLLGNGVEMTTIKDKTFNVAEGLDKFLASGGNLLACGTCLTLRHREAGVCSISTMSELVKTIADSDKLVTLG